MAVTLKQIAQVAGVSVKTASRVLAGQGHLHTAETRQRVDAAARKLGYRANIAARAVVTGRFHAVALLLSSVGYRSTLPWEMHHGILDALAQRKLHLLTARLPDRLLADEAQTPRILREMACDGLLINYTHAIPQPLLDLIAAQKIPSIWINSPQKYDCVYVDDRRAGLELTRQALRDGHRKIAYVDYSHDLQNLAVEHYSARDRLAGYVRAMRAARLPARIHHAWVPGGLPRPQRLAHIQRWLAGPDRPTAVVTYAATDSILAVAATLGLRVPADLEIYTFGNAPVETFGRIFPTMVLPQYALGVTAVELLMRKLECLGRRLKPRRLRAEYHPAEP